MNIFKRFSKWFCAGTEKKKTLADLIAYIEPGDLDALNLWVNSYITYKPDTDAAGNYDRTKEFQGAELTIRRGEGDCEDIASVYVECIRAWKYWDCRMILMFYANPPGHAVAFFMSPTGRSGWFDRKIYYGNINDLLRSGPPVRKWHFCNDLGDNLGQK